jgi:hypothetical protein
MTIVQLAISNQAFRESLRNHLEGDGKHNVIVADKPDPSLSGLIVIESGLLGELWNPRDPDKFVVIVRQGTEDLPRLWRAGFKAVVFSNDSAGLAYLAILRAEIGKRLETTWPTLSKGGSLRDNGLKGPFALSDDVIDCEVTLRSPGVYALALDNGETFHIRYVGRSDLDLNNQLHVHVGSYERFKYEYCPSAKDAFEKECSLFHDFDPEGNFVHPGRPSGTGWRCPRCLLFSGSRFNC